MTALEVVDTVGSWKLGGTYEDESAANTQLRILNMVNIARQSVLREYYSQTRSIPQACYQEFDIDVSWTEQEGCLSFVANVPQVVSFPEPQINGWDSIVPICEKAMPLTEVRSQSQLRQYRNNSVGKAMRSSGWYLVTGDLLNGYLKPQVKSNGLTGRAVLAKPQDAQGFNIEKDQYPLGEDMLSDIKRFLEAENARRWAMANSQISDSKTTIENGRGK
jgi:hypothetical protein